MNRYALSVAPELDLDEIWDSITQDNIDAADYWISKIFYAFEALALGMGAKRRRYIPSRRPQREAHKPDYYRTMLRAIAGVMVSGVLWPAG